MVTTLIFLAEKNVSTHIFTAKISIYLENTLATTVSECVINNLVKLTMF